MSGVEENYKGVFDSRLGFGEKAALLIVDFVKAYTTPGSPLYAPAVAEAVRRTVPLREAAQEKGLPVFFTRVEYHSLGLDGGIWLEKVPALRGMTRGNPLADIVDELPVGERDVVLVKNYASAFFGTALAATLTAAGIDTILLAGCSTSGCIRATAVDGLQHGFRVVVPRECVGDRHPQPHEANLFDIHAKYGDVVSLAEVVDWIASRPVGKAAG